MSAEESLNSASEQIIKQDETYTHERHGPVKVTGIWQGVRSVDQARDTTEENMIVLRYTPLESSNHRTSLDCVDTLDEFLDAIDT
ncbi:hypothetical protein [Natronorubrum aibiense]|uniref:Uncharacterized protein n=1 Tax=Natronorubrum aibiense TaxID=348826 RepID=A0A5P9P042_9EURY|nr:hypothetical protein [Natronorubrum aibiense]QFU81518.1 hypothetical protein GCU68_02550 [Natronorubrum aibiense]